MADQTPITRAANAIESTIRSHIVPAVVAPAIAAPTYFGATMPDLARAAFDSIDVAELARVLWPYPHPFESALSEHQAFYYAKAEAVKAHLTSLPAFAAGAE